MYELRVFIHEYFVLVHPYHKIQYQINSEYDLAVKIKSLPFTTQDYYRNFLNYFFLQFATKKTGSLSEQTLKITCDKEQQTLASPQQTAIA